MAIEERIVFLIEEDKEFFVFGNTDRTVTFKFNDDAEYAYGMGTKTFDLSCEDIPALIKELERILSEQKKD